MYEHSQMCLDDDMDHKKTRLTPDAIQMIAEHTQVLILESEARQAKMLQTAILESEARQAQMYATKEEMRILIRDTVSDVVDEKITEKIGLLPTREEFFSRLDQLASMFEKHEQELLLLSHQYHRHDKRLDLLEEDVADLRNHTKRSSQQGR